MLWKCNFSYKHYFEVLDYAKKEYTIGTIKEFKKLQKKKKFIILRHDIDYSLDHALRMAEEENAHGLKSTYFVMLHSPMYNALSEDSVSTIKKISRLGHEIGLHYDTAFLPKSRNDTLKSIKKEAMIIEDVCGTRVISVAQHNPTINPRLRNDIITHFFDARSPEINNTCRYISDSMQNWRSGCMCNHIDKEDKLQILTHPIWWSNQHKFRDRILEETIRKETSRISTIINSYRKIYAEYLKQISNR